MILPSELEEIAAIAVDVGLGIHRDIGPGLLESVYETFLAHQLEKRGLLVERQKSCSAIHDGVVIPNAFRIDILVENRLVLEIKSVDVLAPVHSKQLLTYLRMTRQPLWLLLNFGGATFREGIRRIINSHKP